MILLFLSACNQNNEENMFVPSTIHSDFPMPSQAILFDDEIKRNNFLAQADYHVEGLELQEADNPREIFPKYYYNEIINWGWEEYPESEGVLRSFEKNGDTILVAINNGYLGLALLKAPPRD